MGGNSKLLVTMGCVAAMASGCANEMIDPGGRTGVDGVDGTAEPLDLGNNPFLVPLDAIPLDEVTIRDEVLSQRAIYIGNDLAAQVMSEVMTAQISNLGTESLTMLTRGLRPDAEASAAIAGSDGIYSVDRDGAVPPPSLATPAGDLTNVCVYAQTPSEQALANQPCSLKLNEALDRAETEVTQRLATRPLDGTFQESANAANWYATAANFGLGNLIAPMAVQLRGQSLCDQVVTPGQSAFERGIRIGEEQLRAEAEAIRPRMPTEIAWNADRNLCNPESQIVFPARTNVMGRIDQIVNSNPLCVGFTSGSSDETARYAQSMQEFRTGIAEGVTRAASDVTQEFMVGPNRVTCAQMPPPSPPPASPAPPFAGSGSSAGTPPWASLPPTPGSATGTTGAFSSPGGPTPAEQLAAAAAEAQRVAQAVRSAQAIANGVRTAMSVGRMLGGLFEPLTLDLNGDGVHMESVENGPVFDFGNGPVRTAWAGHGDALLAMDRNGDGNIVATELFGDITVTEDGAQAPEGWAALALYDMASRGGNGDGVIDENDAAFTSLSLWLDSNGDAQVQPGELQSLSAHGVLNIDLNWQRFTRADGSTGEAVDLWFPYEDL